MAVVTRYIDNRLTTGANDGTTPADAYRSLEAFRAGSGASTVDIVSFVAGSGPYREVASTVKTGIRTDISFDAATKTITTLGGNFTTNGFQTGDIIRVMGSMSNDRQLTVGTVGTTTLTVNSANVLTTESAGASINIASLTRGSNLAVLDLGGNGALGRPRRWLFNGCELDASLPLSNANGYTWIQSTTNPSEWYVRRTDGSNPSLAQVYSGTQDGEFVCDAADLTPDMGTVGSLSAMAPWGWGDNDSLGYSTLYIRGTNPNMRDIRAAQVQSCIATSWECHSFEDGIFSYANKGPSTSGVIIRNGGAKIWWIRRCLMRYATFNGAQGYLRADACVTYFTGHRGWAYDSGAGTSMEIYNCVDYGSHLFMLIGVNAVGPVTIRNCISMYNEAGAIDKKSAVTTLTESHNVWFPRFGASGAALGYINTANWPTTAATDYPPSAATTISTKAANVAAGAVDPLLVAPTDVLTSAAQFKSLRTYSSAAVIFFIRDFTGKRFTPGSRGAFTL